MACTIDHLPIEILEIIFKLLSLKDVGNCCQVCLKWDHLITAFFRNKCKNLPISWKSQLQSSLKFFSTNFGFNWWLGEEKWNSRFNSSKHKIPSNDWLRIEIWMFWYHDEKWTNYMWRMLQKYYGWFWANCLSRFLDFWSNKTFVRHVWIDPR